MIDEQSAVATPRGRARCLPEQLARNPEYDLVGEALVRRGWLRNAVARLPIVRRLVRREHAVLAVAHVDGRPIVIKLTGGDATDNGFDDARQRIERELWREPEQRAQKKALNLPRTPRPSRTRTRRRGAGRPRVRGRSARSPGRRSDDDPHEPDDLARARGRVGVLEGARR